MLTIIPVSFMNWPITDIRKVRLLRNTGYNYCLRKFTLRQDNLFTDKIAFRRVINHTIFSVTFLFSTLPSHRKTSEILGFFGFFRHVRYFVYKISGIYFSFIFRALKRVKCHFLTSKFENFRSSFTQAMYFPIFQRKEIQTKIMKQRYKFFVFYFKAIDSRFDFEMLRKILNHHFKSFWKRKKNGRQFYNV